MKVTSAPVHFSARALCVFIQATADGARAYATSTAPQELSVRVVQ